MELTCRRQDQGRFDALGFTAQDWNNPDADSATIVMVDEEANYAHSGLMPADIPYHGCHGPGDEYGAGAYACDGQEYAEVETGHTGSYVVDWNEARNRPTPRSLRSIRRYIAVYKKVRERFEALPKSAAPSG